MSEPTDIDSQFPKRTLRTTLIAGGILSVFAAQYLGLQVALGFALGVALGALHLYTWIGLGHQILGPREPVWIAIYLILKLGVVYGGAVVYLTRSGANAKAFAAGFTLLFAVIIQKVVGQKLMEKQRLRSVP